MYCTHTGPIGCTMLLLWPHKYKVGHIDLILIYHQNLLNSPEIPEFSCVSYKDTYATEVETDVYAHAPLLSII